MRVTKRQAVLLVLPVLLCFGLPSRACRAEYPALQAAIASAAQAIAKTLRGKRTIVYVRDVTDREMPWRLCGALRAETVASLRGSGIDAVDGEREPGFVWHPAPSAVELPASLGASRWAPGFDALVLGQLLTRADGAAAEFAVYYRDKRRVAKRVSLTLGDDAVALPANTPEMNCKVLEFVLQRFGQCIGDGECATAASEALKSANAKTLGLYHWGRQLPDGEAWLPGDIIQLEEARFVDRAGRGYATFVHHTVVIEEVLSPHSVSILQQNAGAAGKTISRARFDFADLQSGAVVVYRPADGNSPLPLTLRPRSREPARIVKNISGQIDLLQTIDPYVDAVHGIWHRSNGDLVCHRETYARLQIPVDVPESYAIQATVKREFGKDQLGFGLVIGGRQTMLVLDSYGGTVTGLHILDGKKVNAQPSSLRKSLLPVGVNVKLAIAVTPNSVELTLDGKPAFKWAGDCRRLSMQPEWEVPRTDWLFLTSYHSYIRIKSLTLTARN